MRADRNGWRRVQLTASVQGMLPDVWCYQKETNDEGHLSVLVGPEPDGFHMSISHRLNNSLEPGRYPTWDEIVEARYEFCPKNITMAMMLPPKEEYVNVHETTFHLWSI